MQCHLTTDVLICGAGPAGLTLAIELARRGIAFQLIEQRVQPFEGSRGKGIQPRTLEIFADMGVLDAVLAQGGSYPPKRYYRDGTTRDEASPEHITNDAEPFGAPWLLPQFLTERCLRDRLQALGHAPHFGQRLIDFQQDEDGVTATIERESSVETIRARYLVATDGGRSAIRKALGVGFPGEDLHTRALVADLALTGLTRDAWHIWGDQPVNTLMIVPLHGTPLFQLQAPLGEHAPEQFGIDEIRELIAARANGHEIAVEGITWSSTYSMSARLADQFRIGNVFLAGDAAHIHPPTGGQGLNTSIQDAYNLGWKLAAALQGAPNTLLDSYEAERRPIAAGMLALATRLLDAFRQNADLHRGREAQQLELHYRDSPLTISTQSESKGPQPGDRAPDARCMTAAGQETRLFQHLSGTAWTLLANGTTSGSDTRHVTALQTLRVAPDGDLVDEKGQIAAHYALADGDLLLIRPDGYIAMRVGRRDEAAVLHYLAQHTPPRQAFRDNLPLQHSAL